MKDPYVDVTDQGARVQTKALRIASRVTGQPSTRRFLKAAPTEARCWTSPGRPAPSAGSATWTARSPDPAATPPGRSRWTTWTAHVDDLGMVAGDLATLHLKRDYRDIAGTHHLYFTQTINGLRRRAATA